MSLLPAICSGIPGKGTHVSAWPLMSWSCLAAPKETGVRICNGAKRTYLRRWCLRSSHRSNTAAEMQRKRRFYQRYGVEEYYVYDPGRGRLAGWVRHGARLRALPNMAGWVSSRLGVRFTLERGELQLYRPDGAAFLPYAELYQRVEQERQRAERLATRLRALGLDPEENGRENRSS